jgi:hypothetical protein
MTELFEPSEREQRREEAEKQESRKAGKQESRKRKLAAILRFNSSSLLRSGQPIFSDPVSCAQPRNKQILDDLSGNLAIQQISET